MPVHLHSCHNTTKLFCCARKGLQCLQDAHTFFYATVSLIPHGAQSTSVFCNLTPYAVCLYNSACRIAHTLVYCIPHGAQSKSSFLTSLPMLLVRPPCLSHLYSLALWSGVVQAASTPRAEAQPAHTHVCLYVWPWLLDLAVGLIALAVVKHTLPCLSQGKACVRGAASGEVLKGATFRGGIPEGWTDLRRPHVHKVPPPVPDDTVKHVIKGTASECSLH